MQPLVTLSSAYEGKLDLLVKVGKDGRVSETVLPQGVLPWMEKAARLPEGSPRFLSCTPQARRGGILDDGADRLQPDAQPARACAARRADLRSDDEQIVSAYRACYPAGRSEEVKVNYRITVTDGGRVRKAEVVSSSGDDELDQAGVCILRKLVFVPARRNGVDVESTLNWPILVRPPG